MEEPSTILISAQWLGGGKSESSRALGDLGEEGVETGMWVEEEGLGRKKGK